MGGIVSDDANGVRIWAPGLANCEIRIFETSTDTNEYKCFQMTPQENGFFFQEVDGDIAEICYDLRLSTGLTFPDPYAVANIGGSHGRSLQYFDVDGQSRLDHSKWKGISLCDAVVMEIHIGAFTPEGTFNACRKKLQYLTETGITVIQLMPILLTPGDRNWGYDPVSFFTLNPRYGTLDDLRALVDCAHDNGISIVLDCVLNHLGPEGNYMGLIAPQIFDEHLQTPWGNAINLSGASSDIVQDIILQSLRFWLEDVRVDGIRIDAGEHLRPNSDNEFLLKVARTVRASCQHENPLIILEHDLYGLDGADREKLFVNDGYNLLWNQALLSSVCATDIGPLERGGILAMLVQQISIQSSDEHRSKLLPFTNFLRSHDTIGNADQDCRNATIDAEMWRDFLPVLLLTPLVPMVFMGDEWFCDNPFHFFCDLKDTCERDICDARAREFKNPELVHRSPMSNTTYWKSKLNWDRASNNVQMGMRQLFSALVEARRTFISPLMSNGVTDIQFWRSSRAGREAIRYYASDGKILTMMCTNREVPENTYIDFGELVFSNDCFEPARKTGFLTEIYVKSNDRQ